MSLEQQIQEFLKQYAKSDLEGWAWIDLPETKEYNYILLLEWVDGYDKTETGTFIKDGWALEASVRIDDGQYFKNDNLYPIYTEQGDVLTGYTLTDSDIEDNFKSITQDLIELYRTAVKSEQIHKKFIESEI